MKDILKQPILALMLLLFYSCGDSNDAPSTMPVHERVAFYTGADLSYVNEMVDCGASYLQNGNPIDPYNLFASEGCNLTRVRLWHTPDWTHYSSIEDVEKTILLAKNNNMDVLLDFHYSDSWADPGTQIIPRAWEDINNLTILGDSVYQYTFNTLSRLHSKGLLPTIVQVGNEINSEILLKNEETEGQAINWSRNAFLLNQGLKAVEDFNSMFGQSVDRMLHIAQPENVLWWFSNAAENNITSFEWIGFSYYAQWSSIAMNDLSDAIVDMKAQFNKRIMIVETGYPHTLNNFDGATNLLGIESLTDGYPATPEGQLSYLLDLKQIVNESGGEGLVYWEPTWVSTDCHTPWGHGSHWDNATFFDATNNEALPAFLFYKD